MGIRLPAFGNPGGSVYLNRVENVIGEHSFRSTPARLDEIWESECRNGCLRSGAGEDPTLPAGFPRSKRTWHVH